MIFTVNMSPNTQILLFGTMGDISGAVRKALEGHGLSVADAGFPQNVLRDEAGYRRELLKAVELHRPGVILPIGCQIAIARMKGMLPEDVVVPVAGAEIIALLDSKTGCYSAAEAAGVPLPHRYASAEEAGDRKVIFKRDCSFGGSGVRRPKDRYALANLVRREEGKPCIIEDCIEGEDYSVDAVRWGGTTFYGCYRSMSGHGTGPAEAREKVDCPMLEEYAAKILDLTGYQGVCGMDFRVDKGGNAFFLECNPRFTGGVAFQHSHGFNIPYLLYRMAMGD